MLYSSKQKTRIHVLKGKWWVSKNDTVCALMVSFWYHFGEKWTDFWGDFLGTFVFGVKSRIPIFENDTGGGLKKLRFWVLNGDFFEK
jgi:hypothetical protein